jgi:hypothetical protein
MPQRRPGQPSPGKPAMKRSTSPMSAVPVGRIGTSSPTPATDRAVLGRPGCFRLQPAARSHSVQVAVDVKLQQIPRRICRAARHLRRNAAKPRCREIQPVNKGVNKPYRVIRTDIVIHCLRQKQQLRAVVTSDVRHARFYRVTRRTGIRSARLFTQSARVSHGGLIGSFGASEVGSPLMADCVHCEPHDAGKPSGTTLR